MTTNRAYRAMEFIGDDLIDRAEMYFGAKTRRPAAVWTKGIAVAASISLIAGGAYAGMRYWNGTENVGTDLPSLNAGGSSAVPSVQTSEKAKPATSVQTTVVSEHSTPETDGESPSSTMERRYRYHEGQTSFAKIKIDEFGDVYQMRWLPGTAILIKATVVEDYYDTIKSGTQITLRVSLIKCFEDNGRQPICYNAQVLTDFLSKFDYFFFYSWGIQMEYFSPLDKDEFFSEEMHIVDLGSYGLLPISDGTLDLTSLRAFWDENGIDHDSTLIYSSTRFWNYVQDGMDESVFAENIRENKERQIGEQLW